MINLPTSATCTTSILSLCVKRFEGMERNYKEEGWISSKVVLPTRKKHLTMIKSTVVAMILGPFKTYTHAYHV